jgi:hypothetical protein
MNVEDSYEGAVRRLRRLGHAGLDLAPPALAQSSAQADERMRELEELATLACDENDRLQRELDGAREQINRLQGQVTSLQEMLASSQPDESFAAPKPRGRAAALFFLVAIVGVGVAALFTARPWAHRQMVVPVVEPPAPVVQPSAPVVPAPPPIVPQAAPVVPKIASVVAAPQPAKIKPTRKHAAKHHAKKSARHASKRGPAHSASSQESSGTDDPLGGTKL